MLAGLLDEAFALAVLLERALAVWLDEALDCGLVPYSARESDLVLDTLSCESNVK